jgi:hypothetical protein
MHRAAFRAGDRIVVKIVELCAARGAEAFRTLLRQRRVLRVVDEKVGAVNKFGVSQILPSEIPLACCQHARVRFVVTSIHHRYPVGFQPITEREHWMIQISGGDVDIVDTKSALDKIVIANLGSALIQRDGEIGILHLPGQSLTQ